MTYKDVDGVVCLPAVGGEAPATDRLLNFSGPFPTAPTGVPKSSTACWRRPVQDQAQTGCRVGSETDFQRSIAKSSRIGRLSGRSGMAWRMGSLS